MSSPVPSVGPPGPSGRVGIPETDPRGHGPEPFSNIHQNRPNIRLATIRLIAQKTTARMLPTMPSLTPVSAFKRPFCLSWLPR